MKVVNNKILISLQLLCFFFSPFVLSQTIDVKDIKVSGLKRVSSYIVFSAINIEAGMAVDETDLQQLIRDLFSTEYFSDVQAQVNDNILSIKVTERPIISLILIEGNKVIPTESLIQGLNAIELGENEVFKQSALENISRQLSSQYSALGRYAAKVETFVKDIGQNQVQLGIRIDEGQVSRIKHINIVGNQFFDEEELLDLFRLHTTGTWSWLTGSDKYAREELAGDLERLRSFYLDRGYLQFDISSSQVALSPDKETVYITVNIFEGEPFTITEVNLAGDPVLSEATIQSLITLSSGETFSQLELTRSERAITERLSAEGYSAAVVSGSTELNEDDKTATITFFVDPGAITYVRRITFLGNTATSDHVLRREMRQIEGAPVSSEKLRQSKLRLERLGLFSRVDIETVNIAGSNDQIDVIFTVAEQSTASVNASVGYSNSTGVSFGAGLQHNNWLGSGNTFGFNIEQSENEKNYSLNFNNPYYTKEGVSRGVSLYFRERDFSNLSVSQYATNSFGTRINFGYPISETGRVSFGLGFENTTVETGITTVQEIASSPSYRDGVNQMAITQSQYNDILDALGGLTEADSNNNGLLDEDDTISSSVDQSDVRFDVTPVAINDEFSTAEGFIDQYGDKFDALSLTFGWSNSTFNRGIFPTEGLSQKFSTELAIPAADLEYYKLSYSADAYFPIGSDDISTFRIRGRLAYADAYGETNSLPFFENYYAGGIGSVRGFESNSLGPKGSPALSLVAVPVDVDGDNVLESGEYYYVNTADGLLSVEDDDVSTIGGDTLLELSAEIIFPTPLVSNKDKVRTTLFVDAGNVFSSNCGIDQENCSSIDVGKLSISGGFSLQWLSPIAPLSFSFARPLVEQPFDKTQFFQFSLGRTF